MSSNPRNQLERALGTLADRIEAIDGSLKSRQEVATQIRLAAVYIGDGALSTGCDILADVPRKKLTEVQNER